MRSLALQHLESLLQAKQLARTIPALDVSRPPRMPTGMAALDEQLGGGWPQGEISEVVGSRSTGRTSALMATLRAATAHGGVAAVVDAVDRFDPRSAAAVGIDLGRVLWVRGPALVVETVRASCAEDVVVTAVRAFDLVVRAGGFALVVLDLADMPSRHVRALPQATWLRLAHANAGRGTAGLLVGEAPMGRSPRGVTLHVDAAPEWAGASPQSWRFHGFSYRARRTSEPRLTATARHS